MDGTLKFFVEVHTSPQAFEHRTGRLKQVHTIFCDEEECDKKAVEFVKMNKHLPIVRALFVPRPRDVSLNFTR